MSSTLSHSVNKRKFVRPSPSKLDNVGTDASSLSGFTHLIFHETVQVLTQELISTPNWKGKHNEDKFCVGSKVNQVLGWKEGHRMRHDDTSMVRHPAEPPWFPYQL